MDLQLGNIGSTIQLAIAPVFLLTGVGTTLVVLTNRLARIIDRSRVLEERVVPDKDVALPEVRIELQALYRRAVLINRAVALSTACALLVCVVIAALFIGAAINVDLATFIGVSFVLCMFSLTGSFLYLLQEIYVATQVLAAQRLIMLDR